MWPSPGRCVSLAPGTAADLAISGESALDPASIRILAEVRAEIAAVGAPVVAGSTSPDLSAPTVGGPLFNQAVVFDGCRPRRPSFFGLSPALLVSRRKLCAGSSASQVARS